MRLFRVLCFLRVSARGAPISPLEFHEAREIDLRPSGKMEERSLHGLPWRSECWQLWLATCPGVVVLVDFAPEVIVDSFGRDAEALGSRGGPLDPCEIGLLLDGCNLDPVGGDGSFTWGFVSLSLS